MVTPRFKWLLSAMYLAAAAAAAADGLSVSAGTHTGADTDRPVPPPTPAQAMAQHHDALRKCWRLDVAAVREECQRQARRTLDQQQAQWQRQRAHPWQAGTATRQASRAPSP